MTGLWLVDVAVAVAWFRGLWLVVLADGLWVWRWLMAFGLWLMACESGQLLVAY